MKKLLLTCISLLSMIGAWASTAMPTLSTQGNETWYYMHFLNGNAVVADKGASAKLVTELPRGLDKQLWKVEAGTVNGQYILTSKLGNKITWDATSSTYISSATGTEFVITATANATYTPGWELQKPDLLTKAINQISGGGPGKNLGEWDKGDGGNVLVFNTAKDELPAIITNATSLYNSTTEGTTIGTYPTQARTDFSAAIAAAQSVQTNIATKTEAEVLAAETALSAAYTTYLASIISPVKPTLSTQGNETWYYMHFSNGNAVIADKGASAKLMTENSLGLDKQLWKVEAGTASGQYIFTSKLGNKITWDATASSYISSSTGTEFLLTPTANTTYTPGWELQKLDLLTKAINQNSGGGAGRTLADYNKGDGSNVMVFNTAKDELQYMLTYANSLLTSTTEGTTEGTYPTQARTDLSTAIAAAQSVQTNIATKTEAEVLAAEVTFGAAIMAYGNARIMSIKSTAASPVWYVIKTKATDTRANAVLCVGATAPSARNAAANPTDSIMWRMEYDASMNRYALINKLTNTSLSAYNTISAGANYIFNIFYDATKEYTFQRINTTNFLTVNTTYTPLIGFSMTSSTTGTANNFQVIPGITVHKNAMKTTLDSINTAKVSYTIGTAVGQYPQSAKTQLDAACTAAQTLYDNASATYDQAAAGRATIRAAWKTFTQSQNTITGFKSNERIKVTVYSVNKLIVVRGAEGKARAFTITGSEVDITKPVNTGVYIVKAAGQTFKINVE